MSRLFGVFIFCSSVLAQAETASVTPNQAPSPSLEAALAVPAAQSETQNAPPVTSSPSEKTSLPIANGNTPTQPVLLELKLDGSQSAAELFNRIRDPFRKPDRGNFVEKKSDLELFPVEQYELVGVITGPAKTRAMVRSPDSKTLMVAEGKKMGVRSGIVRKITAQSLVVREKLLNILGQQEEVDTEIRISPKLQAKNHKGG